MNICPTTADCARAPLWGRTERLAKSGTFTAEIRDRIARIGRFLERIAQLGEERVMTGERVTEETLQSIWRATEYMYQESSAPIMVPTKVETR